MAKAKAGPAPWNVNADGSINDTYHRGSNPTELNWQEKGTGPRTKAGALRRHTKATQEAAGLEWSLSAGWRQRPDDYWSNKPHKPKMKRIKHYNGRFYDVPDGDYERMLGYQGGDIQAAEQAIIDYVDTAKITQQCSGVGHIASLEYSPAKQVMFVEFAEDQGGATVVFLWCPKEVYSELKHLADSGSTSIGLDGTTRHVMGMRFWDIVRIRGSRHGAKYDFYYVSKPEKQETKAELNEQQAYLKEAVQELGIGLGNKKLKAERDEHMKERFVARFPKSVKAKYDAADEAGKEKILKGMGF